MTVLALDISTKTGWAVFDNGKLTAWGTQFPDKTVKEFGSYPRNFVYLARYLVETLWTNVIMVHYDKYGSDFQVVIEETNPGRNAYSQKLLEFIHLCVIERLRDIHITPSYIRTGDWRSMVQARLSKDEKALNAKISRIKKQEGTKLAKIDGKVVGRKGSKHVAIRVVQELYGIELRRKDEDTADAILLGTAFLKGAPTCDGTTKSKKSKGKEA